MMYRVTAFTAAIGLALGLASQDRTTTIDPLELARQQLIGQGYGQEDVQDLRVRDRYTDRHSGVEHVFLRQYWQGVPVFNGDVALHLAPGRALVAFSSGAIKGIGKRVQVVTPSLTDEQALRQVLGELGLGGEVRRLEAAPEAGRSSFRVTGLEEDPFVERCIVAVEGQVRTAWNVNVYLPDGSHWWNIRLDDATGEELERNDWVSQCAFDVFGDAVMHDHAHADAPPPAPAAPNDYNVYALPLESPNHGGRTLENAPWSAAPNASPFGWHDTDGVPGAELTITRGNNVWAQEDADGNNGTGYSPDGGVDLDFDFPIDLTQAPSTYQDAAITNLFYWNNIIHDVWYQYGFDEPSGNFQENNYGNGGVGGDHVLADAQDGSGINNANFGTPPDGSDPRMQMFLWNTATPQIDGDLDNGIIAHEYAHGVSNRLVGGPSNTGCLGNAEQMGEGWSDFFSLIMTMDPGDLGTDARGIGTFALDQPIAGPGIRPAPYSTDFGVNSYTYASTNSSGLTQPHGIGFVWCTMLWEMTWELIDVYGFDPDLYNGTGGNNIAMQLVIDGLKLTPCNPGFVDGRDAILQADQIVYGGANQDLIWAAFARRGLGASADQGASTSRSDQIEAFDLPVDDNVGVSAPVYPVPGALFDCGNGGIVKVQVRNSGLLDQANFPVSYQLDNGPVVTQNYPGTLTAGATAIMDFGNTLTVTGTGPHTFRAWTALPGDAFQADDTLTVPIDLQVPAATPFSEDVEGGLVLPLGWSLENPDAGNTWTTASLQNGPDCAPTTAWRLDHFSYAGSGQLDFLVSPVIDLSTATNSRLTFDHAYVEYSSFYSDGFRVEVSADCGANWNVVFDESGPVLATAPINTGSWQPSNCSDWRSNLVDLSAFDGQEIQVRFVSVNGYGNNFYLDNVLVESAFADDVALLAVTDPLPGVRTVCDLQPVDVTVQLWNAGLNGQSNVPLFWQLDNGPIVSELVPGALASLDTTTYVFSTQLVIPGSGNYQVKVWSGLAGDQQQANDTLTVDLVVDPSVTLPFLVDFEGESLCAVTTNCGTTVCPLSSGWSNAVNGAGDDIDWRVDEGGTASANTGPATDLLPGTPQGNYVYLEASGSCTGQEAHLLSPCFDLQGAVQPLLRVGYHMYGVDMGELHVDLHDGGSWTLDIAPAIVGDQGNQWDTLLVDLSAWSGQQVRIRLRGITGAGFTSDLALDAIELFDAAPPVLLAPRVMLEGPYDPVTGLMRDDLRVNGLVPTSEPYTALGFLGAGSGGEVIDDPTVLSLAGNDAVVDWVEVELRDANDASVVLLSVCGLVQRDGDVVATDGSSPLAAAIQPGDYFIAVRHRNHLGAMTAQTVTLGLSPVTVDLTVPGTATFGTDARKDVGGVMVLWAGEVITSGSEVKYTGAGNDRDPILQAIGGTVPTSTLAGYHEEDVNMDGSVKYTGTGNDRDPILQNIGGIAPTSIRQEQLP